MRRPKIDPILSELLHWIAFALAVGAFAGSASAFLLLALDWATAWREAHLWVIALLPLSGLAVGAVYHRWGRAVEGGNNLIIDEIHDPRVAIQLRMAPFVLFGTVATHLFGGSAGREGTAVQMGAALADQLSGPLKLSRERRRFLLMTGVSAGFASVFGTPLAGTIFGLEFLKVGRARYYWALVPCLGAAFVGHFTALAWGIRHTAYSAGALPAFTLAGAGLALVAGSAFGATGRLFASATHQLGAWLAKRVRYAPLKPFIGGALVAGAVGLTGATRYIGLGIPTIVEAFRAPLPPYDFAGKFAFTVATLASGFKGGEVTPLFYIGATLGNALSAVLALPLGLLAAMGFVGVFAGAAHTPIAATLMAAEVFGPGVVPWVALACAASYVVSGVGRAFGPRRKGVTLRHTR